VEAMWRQTVGQRKFACYMWEGYTTARTRVYSHQRMCAPKARLVFDLNGLCPKGHAIEDGTAELVGQALGEGSRHTHGTRVRHRRVARLEAWEGTGRTCTFPLN
jgi:hypothetical protein